ncbi:MAG: hypothetical protein ACLT38_12660 [Akkermansia sp.]
MDSAARAGGGKADRWFTSAWFFLFVLANLFEDVAEAFFWNEFEASFNFIAVDYLVYTKEVIGNIYESYPIIPILGGIRAASVLAVWGMKRFLLSRNGAVPAGWKRGCVVLFLLACVTGGYWLVDIKDADAVNNRYNRKWPRMAFTACSAPFSRMNWITALITGRCRMRKRRRFWPGSSRRMTRPCRRLRPAA